MLTRRVLAKVTHPSVSYEVDAAALSADDAELGDTVAVIDTSRNPEWRLKERVVKRVRAFGDAVVTRVTIGVVEQSDYSSWSVVSADVETLKDDVIGIDGDLSTAASVDVVEDKVEEAVDEAIDNLEYLDDIYF